MKKEVDKNMKEPEHVSNLEYLVDLSKGNDQFVKDMVKIFLEENPGEIDLLGKGVKQHDFNLIRTSAHKLRSTAPFVGVDRIIEDEIAELERLAAEYSSEKKIEFGSSGNGKKIQVNIPEKSVLFRMRSLYDRIREVFHAACNELTAYAA
jgi:HPt (histidine-containing phosphotransfer) domain-containing protein